MTFIKKLNQTNYKKDKTILSGLNKNLLAWTFPFSISEWEKNVNPKKKDIISVKSTETAVVFENDQLVQELKSGSYQIERNQGATDLSIVFVNSSNFELRWGVPQVQGPLTSDNVKIGVSGTIELSFVNTKQFCLNVVKSSHTISHNELKPKINNLIKEALREAVSNYSAIDFQKIGRDELIMLVVPSIIEPLTKLGLMGEDFSLTGLGIPPEFHVVDSYLEQSIEKIVEIDERYQILLVVEGLTELKVLPTIFDKFYLDELVDWREKIGILPMQGTANIKQILNCVGLDFEKLAQRTIVLIDSDRKDTLDSMPNSNRQILEDISNRGGEIYILGKREIENYIHPAVIDRSFPSFKWDKSQGLFADTEDVKSIVEIEKNKSDIRMNTTDIKKMLFERMTAEEFDEMQLVKNQDGTSFKEFDILVSILRKQETKSS